MNLEGTFRPRYRFVMAAFMLSMCALLTWSEWNHRALMHGALFDLKLCPISFGIGLLLGGLAGRWRLRALRAVVSHASEKPMFAQLSSISRTPEDKKAKGIERMAYIALLLMWIAVPFERRGVIVPFAISSAYILGIYLTASFIPFIRLWLESRGASKSPERISEPRTDLDSGQIRLTSGEEIHLRGAFNPMTQMIWGLIVTVVVGGIVATSAGIDSSGIDPYLSPVALALGLWVGYFLGVKRLHVLHEVLPQLDGRFIFVQWDVMMSVPEGAMILKFQGLAFAIAMTGTFAIPAFTDGKVSLLASFALFGLGAFLTGKILPFIRLWSELRGHNRGIGSSA
ncbi:MAG: hypothetical protein WA175_13280 [Candidatus Acidiferrales bacterium]